MVLRTKDVEIQQRIASKKRLLCTTTLGAIFLVIPITFLFFDPFVYMTEYNLRLENGSMLHDLLRRRFVGPKVYIYMFNVTNANEFMSGSDEKVKLQDIGPFVYQEYRINDDLEINQEPGVMRYTPKLQTELILEESIGRPEDFYLTAPNVPMLSATALISKYPFFVRQIFNAVAANTRSKAFRKIRAYDHLWGYSDPFMNIANTAVPGLIYFKSIGLLERLYDNEVEYRLEIGTKNFEKFSVKKVTKLQSKNDANFGIFADVHTYNDSYEGVAFSPYMTPEMPIHIFRTGLCKSFQFQHVGSRSMHYGGDAFVYQVHNTTFMDHQLCDTKGWCPDGLKSLAPCYYGLPFVLSKGHFLDSDPRLLDRVEGLKPDRKKHHCEIIIDPNIGVAVSGFMSLQLNLFLTDVGYNEETRRLKDTVLPVSHLLIKAPPMLQEVKDALHLMYSRGPVIILGIQALCTVFGLGLLLYSARMMYCNWIAKNRNRDHLSGRSVRKAQWPLLSK